MKKTSFTIGEINAKSEIFRYWHDLPQIKVLTTEQYNKSKGVIRQAINRILSIGLEVEIPSTKKKLKRHVLSAKEIKSLIEARTNISIGKSNVYFHLQELEKLGLVQMIDVAVSNKGRGKKFSAYYGRTAKLFRFEPDVNRKKEELNLLYKHDFLNFLKDLNPDISHLDAFETLSCIKRLNQVENEPFFIWLKKNEKLLDKNNIDLNQLGRLIIFLHIYDPEVLEGIVKLRKLLQI